MSALLAEPAGGIIQFETPEEGGSALEVRSDSVNFVDEIFHTEYTMTAQFVANPLVCDRQSLTTNLTESALVYQPTNSFERRISPGNIGINKTQHIQRCLNAMVTAYLAYLI